MRVFDSYYYNIIDRVKYKDTKRYIDKMLGELGLCYHNIGFGMKCGPVKKAVEKYPVLAKYRCLEDETRPAAQLYTNELLTSYSRNWSKGEIYGDAGDYEVIEELFTKIPRTFNFGFSNMILSGIDWYGGCDLTPAIEYNEFKGEHPLESPIYISCNEIMLRREFDYGNKRNRVIVTVEATKLPVPKDTSDIVKRLKPYLGTPEYVSRTCRLPEDELKRCKELETEYKEKLQRLFESAAGSGRPSSDMLLSPAIPKLVEKKKIVKAFGGTGFEMGNRHGLLPGMNRVICTDSHNYKYEITIDRGSAITNCIHFNFMVMGCDFTITPSIPAFYVKSEEEAEQIIAELVKLCVRARDEIGEEMAAQFLDTPDWYWEKRSWPDW